MQKDEAIKILARHLMQCGMLMPMEWVQKNGEDSEFMEAYKMAMDALKNDPVRCKNCKHYYDLGVDSILRHKFGLSWDDAAGLRKEIKRLQDATKWIPVTERLPEDGECLAFVKHTYGKYIRLLRFAKDGRKVDKYDFYRGWKNVWYYYDSEWGHITIDDVTHWMPLPELPKGE